MKCDLHIHTCYSYDSSALPKEMVDSALRKGIDCIAITDHNEVKGALEALEYARRKPILIIPGVEVKTKEGDILALNVNKIIPKGLSVKETIKKIKEEGGIAILPHPFGFFCSFTPLRNRKFLTGFKENLKDLISEVDEAMLHLHLRSASPRSVIDGIEVLNASVFGSGNKKALDFAKKYNLPFTCGSDAHFPNLVGRVFLEIPGEGENLSIEEVLKKIKNREGKIGGLEASFFEKIIDHLKRNLVKLKCLRWKIKHFNKVKIY